MRLTPFPEISPAPAMAGAGLAEYARSALDMPAMTTARQSYDPEPLPFAETGTPPMPAEPDDAREPQIPRHRAIPRMHMDQEYTDEDLREALAPFLSHEGGAPTTQLHEDFEVMLRAAIRRALAQFSDSPFDEPDFVQRVMWRFDALVSSRTYDEVVQEKVNRFRIEEVFLLHRPTLSMISFASVNPGRHANPHKVRPIVNRLAGKAAEMDSSPPLEFNAGKGIKVFLRARGELLLAALIRGEPDSFTGPDLDYALMRIERTYGQAIEEGTPLLREIQPHLEECLLIHSPMAPAER